MNNNNENFSIIYNFYTNNYISPINQKNDSNILGNLLSLSNENSQNLSILDDYCKNPKIEKIVIFSIFANKMNFKQNLNYLQESQFFLEKLKKNNDKSDESDEKNVINEDENNNNNENRVKLLERLNFIEQQNTNVLEKMRKLVEYLQNLGKKKPNPGFSMKKIEKIIGNTL